MLVGVAIADPGNSSLSSKEGFASGSPWPYPTFTIVASFTRKFRALDASLFRISSSELTPLVYNSSVFVSGPLEVRMLCCAVLCCAVLCCAVLCCAVLCCAVLFCLLCGRVM
jgi:hypothetical protein